MTEPLPDIKTVAKMLAERAEDFCSQILPEARKEGDRLICGSYMGETGKSMCVNLDGPYKGNWKDFATGDKGDLVTLISMNRRCAMHEAYRFALKWLGYTIEKPSEAKQDRAEYVKKIWSEGVPVAGTIGEQYLLSRNITNAPPTIRFHRGLKHSKSGIVFPALMAGIQDVENKLIGMQRIFLDPKIPRKANVDDNKMMIGNSKGGVVRLNKMPKPVNGKVTMALCEGVETGLSLVEMNGFFKEKLNYPDMWICAAVSAPNIPLVQFPLYVGNVIVFADSDAAGRAAYHKLKNKRENVGCITPPKGYKDFNDYLPKWKEEYGH